MGTKNTTSVNKLAIRCFWVQIITIVGFIIIIQYGQASWWDLSWFGSNKRGMYCERVHSDDILKENSNSKSNIFFVLIGEIILFFYFYDSAIFKSYRTNSQYPVWSLLYGLSMIYVGIGSFFYHASLKHLAQITDVAAIYAVLIYFHVFLCYKFIVCYLYRHNMPHDPEWMSYLCFCLCIVLDVFAFKYKTRFDSTKVLPISGIIIVIKCLYFIVVNRQKQNAKTFSSLYFGVVALLMIVTGFGIRQMDKIYCNPDSWFQLHSLFHIMVAVGLLFAYLMLRYDVDSIRKCDAISIQRISSVQMIAI
eukprot:73471_1